MLLKGKRIFVVEDDAGNLAIVSHLLQHQGAVVHFDRWGSATIERLRVLQPIDMILVDLMLPRNISGYDIFDQVKAIPDLANIPIVAVTALDSNTEMNKARSKGFSGYLCKPFSFIDFPRHIAAILDGQQIWADDLA